MSGSHNGIHSFGVLFPDAQSAATVGCLSSNGLATELRSPYAMGA
jgi:hypothetical protein